MTSQLGEIPLGVQVIRKASDKCCSRAHINRTLWYRGSVLVLTYLAYMCYHLSRKTISVVKNVLNQNCTNMVIPDGQFVNDSNRATWCDWAPFDKPDAPALLGTLDSAFLFAYAIAMFGSGFVAERVNLRYFLTLGMIASGIASYLFGIAKSYDIHNLWYFIFVQIFGGVAQTTGWPGVVTVVGNWFGKGKRGLIFGIWNSHTSFGNILGSLIAGEYVERDWSLSFIVPGMIIAFAGLGMFLFLVTHPADVGCTIPDHKQHKLVTNGAYRKIDGRPGSGSDDSGAETDDSDILIGHEEGLGPRRRIQEEEGTPIMVNRVEPSKAVGFWDACKIPGVIEFSFSLFFSKLVSYTFLYWLPQYINHSTTLNATLSADLSTLFDVGGIVGAIAAGVISDYSGMSATTCAVMLALTAPMLFVYDVFGSSSLPVNILILLVVGLLVNGPYALITTAVSAELGTHHSLEGNSKALATVTAIIDGTGSIGAAVGPLLAGVVSARGGWYNVFYMLIAADLFALLLLSRMVWHEVRGFLSSRAQNRIA